MKWMVILVILHGCNGSYVKTDANYFTKEECEARSAFMNEHKTAKLNKDDNYRCIETQPEGLKK